VARKEIRRDGDAAMDFDKKGKEEKGRSASGSTGQSTAQLPRANRRDSENQKKTAHRQK